MCRSTSSGDGRQPPKTQLTPNNLANQEMSFTLNKLPYAAEALAPVISKETLAFHYGKHQYVNPPK